MTQKNTDEQQANPARKYPLGSIAVQIFLLEILEQAGLKEKIELRGYTVAECRYLLVHLLAASDAGEEGMTQRLKDRCEQDAGNPLEDPAALKMLAGMLDDSECMKLAEQAKALYPGRYTQAERGAQERENTMVRLRDR